MKPVRVRFFDHSYHQEGLHTVSPLEFEVVGLLMKEDKTAYYIAVWYNPNDPDDDNNEFYVILKNTVSFYEEFTSKESK